MWKLDTRKCLNQKYIFGKVLNGKYLEKGSHGWTESIWEKWDNRKYLNGKYLEKVSHGWIESIYKKYLTVE